MSKGQFFATLQLHACPDHLVEQASGKLLEYDIKPIWFQQPLIVNTSRAEWTSKMTVTKATDLVSDLSSLGFLHLELTQTIGELGLLYMSLPGLGIYRGEMNSAGSLVLSEDQINELVFKSAGNQREFMRLLRLALGQSWDDVLEPLRAVKYSDNVLLLNRAG